MRRIPVASLVPGPPLAGSLYHASGVCLVRRGDLLTSVVLAALRAARIEEVIELDPTDNVDRFIFECRNSRISLDSIRPDATLQRPLYDFAGNLLLQQNALVSDTARKRLRDRGVTALYVRKTPKERDEEAVQVFEMVLRRLGGTPVGAETPESPPAAGSAASETPTVRILPGARPFEEPTARILPGAKPFEEPTGRIPPGARPFVEPTGKILPGPKPFVEPTGRRTSPLTREAIGAAIAAPLQAREFAQDAPITPGRLDSALEEEISQTQAASEAAPIAASLAQVPVEEERALSVKEKFLVLHEYIHGMTRDLYEHIREHEKVDGALVREFASRIVAALVEDRHLLLNLSHLRSFDTYFLDHPLNVCIFSINIAAAMNFSLEQVAEVAFGALLHDVGMLRVPPEIIEKMGEIHALDRQEIQRHAAYGLEELQGVAHIPRSCAFVAFQAHERSDGSGYPRGRTHRQIHPYARIVAVADVYEALTADRPHRPAILPYQAMEQVVHFGNRRQLDPEAIRAFLRVLCLYPIGSWVQLSDMRIGKVVAAGDTAYDRPVVHALFDADRRPLAAPEFVNLSKVPDCRVVRAVDGAGLGVDIMDGF